MWNTVRILLANAARDDIAPMALDAQIAHDLVEFRLPASVVSALRLRHVSNRRVVLPNGNCVQAAYVEPLQIEAFGAVTWCGAVAFGDEVVLGRLALLALVGDDMSMSARFAGAEEG